VILGALLAVAFASGSDFQDWLTFAVLAQFSALSSVLWVIYRYRRWCISALKTIPRDIV
jgi:hypothetical protein